MKVVIDGKIIAESDKTIEIEGNQYFPPTGITENVLEKSDTPYHCPWKGDAQYFNVQIDGEIYKDMGWSYPKLIDGAVEKVGKDFSGYVAFYKDRVEIHE